MYSFTRLVYVTLAVATAVSFAEELVDQSNYPLQCYICAIGHDEAALDQHSCFVTSPNVKVAECAQNHGYDRCIYYRAHLETGAVLLRRQCGTQDMCDGKCLFSNHTNCQMRCCQDDLCNDWIFEEEFPTPPGAKVTTDNPVTDNPVTDNSVKTTKGRPVAGLTVPKSNNCQDQHEDCPRYAAYPYYCDYERDYVMKYCQLSCGFCQPSNGSESVTKTEAATTTSVPETTITTEIPVGGPRGCQDTHRDCQAYADIDGYCQYHDEYMFKYCPRSCGFCVGFENRPNPESPTKSSQVTTESSELEEPTTPYGPEGEESRRRGCHDLRDNCSYYAKKDGYCVYNKDFMSLNCPFSCGICGIKSIPENEAFPHPPVFQDQPARFIPKDFPALRTQRDVRWLSVQCSKCRHGYKLCNSACILLLKNGEYKPTNYETCEKLLGKQEETTRC